MTKHIITTTITSLAIATICACNKDNSDPRRTDNTPVTDQTPIARNAPAERQAINSPITVTGCLQKGSGLGHTYIVTAMNEPSRTGVGTSGNGAAVEREQLREAQNAYRVDPKENVDMDAMVGKQVRVSGTITKRADLPDVPVSPAGQNEPQRTEKLEIDQGDLAKIEEASIGVISDNCGGSRSKAAGSSSRDAAKKKPRG
jgi:hypothetical protein